MNTQNKAKLIEKYNFIGAQIPNGAVKSVLKRAAYVYAGARHENGSLMINSIPKCGTHKVVFFLANYMGRIYENNKNLVDSERLNTIFPNRRDNFLEGHKSHVTPHPIFNNSPYKDLIWGHTTKYLEYFDGKIVFLYRNPFDTIISRYFYSIEYRGKEHTNAADAALSLLRDNYIIQYKTMRKLAEKKNVLMLPYENLMQEPWTAFTILVQWAGLPLHQQFLHESIEASSFESIRKIEDKGGLQQEIPSSNFTGRFTRSGKTGQWREVFDENTVGLLTNELLSHGIKLNEFTME